MLVIKIFSERKKVFRERKKCKKIRAKRSDFPTVTGGCPGVGVGRGVKEKDLNDVNNKEVKDGAVTVASRNTQEENVGQSSTGPTTSESGPDVSFASLLNGESKRKGLNFHTLITQAGNGANVAIWLESIRVVSERYANSDCGFFLGKRVAYPVVANYVRNTWGKYGLVKSMFNSSTGLFFFQFSSMDGLDSMLENEDVVNVPVWVKLHDVPVTVFTKGWFGSVIASNIVGADVELKDTIVVAMPKLTGEGFYTCIVRVEYEWKTPRCACCKVPKGALVGSKVGFKPTKEYRPIAKNPTVNTSSNKNKGVEPTKVVSNLNPFDVLNSVVNDEELGTNGRL
ncbi:hypothetical protein Tco_0796124 [Tanacetum coccineum]